MSGRAKLRLASLWMIAATAVINLSMVVFHRFMSANLGVSYARLVSLMAISNVLGAVTMGVNTFMVKEFSRDAELSGPGAVKGRLLRIWKPAALAISLTCLGLLAVAPLAMAYLKLPSLGEVALVILIFGLGLVLLVGRAAVQGLHHFGSLGASLIAEGFGRVAAGAMLVGPWGVSGGLLGMLGGQLLGGLAASFGLRGLGLAAAPVEAAPGRARRTFLREIGGDSMVLLLFSLMGYLDLFIAKHYYDDAGASAYSRAALVAKSFLHLAAALNLVMLPAVAAAREGGRDTRALLLRFLGGALLMHLAGLAFVWTFTDFCIKLLCGPDPALRELSPLVRVFSAATILQALFQMTLFYLLAMRQKGTLSLVLALAPCYYALLALNHSSGFAVVASLAAVAAVGLLLGLWLAWRPASPPALEVVR